MHLFRNTVGRKVIIAVSGQYMTLFVIFHFLGNTLNPYSASFPQIGFVREVLRMVLLLMFLLHVYFSIQSALENMGSRPGSYAMQKYLRTTFAARTMIWSGTIAGVFILYHLLNFKYAVLEESFQDNTAVAIGYAAGLAALFLHLYHGIAGGFQTMGWNSERSLPVIGATGKIMALLLLTGYIAIMLLNRV